MPKKTANLDGKPPKTHPLKVGVATGGAVGYYLQVAAEKLGTEGNLYYFAGRGKAETTRWMLAATNVKFSNIYLRSNDEFVAMKSSSRLLFGQLPMLELDGKSFTQSRAMVLYLARRANLQGRNIFEEARCAEIAGCCDDLASGPMGHAFRENKEEHKVKVCEPLFKKFGFYLDKLIRDNGTGWSVGESLTYADILIAECLTSYEEFMPGITMKYGYENLNRLRKVVCSLPGLKSYLQSSLRSKFPDDNYVRNVNEVLGRPMPKWLLNKEGTKP